MHDVMIYGAGKWGQQAYREYHDKANVISFLDSDSKKYGKLLFDIPIRRPEEMLDYRHSVILIAVASSGGIKDYLLKLGFSEIFDYTPGIELDIEGYLNNKIQYYHIDNAIQKRESINSMVENIKRYDVISFDVFDTAVYRLVENPQDIFRILGNQKKVNIYRRIRHEAELSLREEKYELTGSREVTLDEIYAKLDTDYGIPKEWALDEIKLELDLIERNEYIYSLYKELLRLDKHIVFTTDMYLPGSVIEKILLKAGYIYENLYLSNERGVSKEDGGLYDLIKSDYPNKKIIHIGDNKLTDIGNAEKKGISAYYYPKNGKRRLNVSNNSIDQSMYNALMSNYLSDNANSSNLYYEHGFRVGGILTVGFCKYINSLVKEKNIDKILFCGRDCKVIFDVYKKFFNECESEYIRISRRAILEVAGKRYVDDYIGRALLKYFSKSNGTIGEVLSGTGFDYLMPLFDESDIEPKAYPEEIAYLNKRCLKLVKDNYQVVSDHISNCVANAKAFFGDIIKNKKNILVVDVGWSGSCISILRDFLKMHFPNSIAEVYGALMCGSRSENYIAASEQGIINTYIYSPYHNKDMEGIMMPNSVSEIEIDRIHMSIENLFTSTENSLFSYERDEEGRGFIEVENGPQNADEILRMQDGIMHFSEIYSDKIDRYVDRVSPYVAFNPLIETIRHQDYCDKVYKNFLYDVGILPLSRNRATYKDLCIEGSNVVSEGFENYISADLLQEPVIISLTSYPKRIGTLHLCLESLLKQSYKASIIEVWLSSDEFPQKEAELPNELLKIIDENESVQICWTKGNLKSHKKYFYSMQKHLDVPIITVDDDVLYSEELVEILMNSYKMHPNAISCTHAHFITHRTDGSIRKYRGWLHNYLRSIGQEKYGLVAVGVGGVLYPPNVMPKRTFEKSYIETQCIVNDDIWLKIHELLAATKTVIACKKRCFEVIPNTQDYGLYQTNLVRNLNDEAIDKIFGGLTEIQRDEVLRLLSMWESELDT